MSIVSFKHIDTETLFAQTKFSAAANNASYYQGDNTELLYFGTPDVMYDDVCFCKEKGVIYTHGAFYNSGNNNDTSKVPRCFTQQNIDALSNTDIFQWQGDSNNTFTKGYFYKREGEIVTVINNGEYYINVSNKVDVDEFTAQGYYRVIEDTNELSSYGYIQGKNSSDTQKYFTYLPSAIGNKVLVTDNNNNFIGWTEVASLWDFGSGDYFPYTLSNGERFYNDFWANYPNSNRKIEKATNGTDTIALGASTLFGIRDNILYPLCITNLVKQLAGADITQGEITYTRIDVQPTPNDVVMCKMSDSIVYDSYITYTKIKQYLPDYPYYSDDLNWKIGGNPPMRASITEGDYYLDVDTNHIFIADENLELQDVTSTVVIQGDSNKLYCNTITNQLYRYDGSNFVAIEDTSKAPNYPTFSTADTRENLLGNGESTTTLWGKIKKWFTDLKEVAFSGSYTDLNNKPLSVENNKVKYTLSDGQTKLTLIQDTDVATTSASGLMSAEDKIKVNTIGTIYRGQLQHNLSVMKSGSNLIHVICMDFENDGGLDCYISARGTTGSASTFFWHYNFISYDQAKLGIACNYNGLINVINNTGRPDSDFILFIDKLI